MKKFKPVIPKKNESVEVTWVFDPDKKNISRKVIAIQTKRAEASHLSGHRKANR